MDDFLRVEIYSKDDCNLILMRSGKDGAVEISRLKVPFETLQNMVTCNWVDETLRDSVIFAENGIFSVDI